MPQYIHYNSNSFDEINILLPGSSLGFQTGFINKIFNRFVAEGRSAISYNYPFQDRGEESSSGPELKEELEALNQVLSLVDLNKYSKINFIGKSLGGIVASFFLLQIENKDLLSKISLSILGYVKGSINLEGITCQTIIIQGEDDKFGNIVEVKKDFIGANISHIKFVEIANADHSYRNKEKEPVFEDQAIDELFGFI